MLSAIVLSYSRPHYLEQTLESIANQNQLPTEIVFSDCTPSSQELQHIRKILEDFSGQYPKLDIRSYFHEYPMEQTLHTHFAMEKCKHSYIAMLHDDDVWLPTHIERSIKYLEENPRCGLCISNAYQIDANSARISQEPPEYPSAPSDNDPDSWFSYLIRRYFSSFSGYVFRKSAIDGFPKFPTQVVDHHLALHIALSGHQINSFVEPSLDYRLHEQDSSASITQRFSLQRERYKLYLRLLATKPIACVRRMPLFPLFALKGLVKLAMSRS